MSRYPSLDDIGPAAIQVQTISPFAPSPEQTTINTKEDQPVKVTGMYPYPEPKTASGPFTIWKNGSYNGNQDYLNIGIFVNQYRFNPGATNITFNNNEGASITNTGSWAQFEYLPKYTPEHDPGVPGVILPGVGIAPGGVLHNHEGGKITNGSSEAPLKPGSPGQSTDGDMTNIYSAMYVQSLHNDGVLENYGSHGDPTHSIPKGRNYQPPQVEARAGISVVDEMTNSGSFYNYGDFNNYFNATDAQGAGSTQMANSGSIYNYGNFTNAGSGNIGATLTNSENGSIYIKSNGLLYNLGIIHNNGLIDTTAVKGGYGFMNLGWFYCNGTLKGSWYDHGHVKVGSSAGGMLVDGNYYKKGGSKEIELGGTYHGDGDRTATEHDWIEITGNLELAGDLDVSLIDGFKLSVGDSFVITKVDGDLSGHYDGLNEGDSVGRFKSDNGGILNLFITYQGGDGNDIELYTKSFFGVLPESLSEPRMIGSDENDSLTGSSADEVIFGGSGDDVLLGAQGDDRVTGGNGDDWLDGGLGDDTLKGDRGADTYKLSSGDDSIEGFSVDENDGISVKDGVDLSFKQIGDDLLLTADGIYTTLLDVDKDEFLAADVIDYI